MKVSVENFRGKLRLRWTHQGKRCCIALGILDGPASQAFASQKARAIELDILSGNYDPTLLKYRLQILGQGATVVKVPALFQRFTDYQFKEKGLAPGSMRRYVCVQAHVQRHLNLSAEIVGDRTAGNFAAYLLEYVAARTAREYLWLLRGCWDWAKTRYRVTEENPWTSQVQRIKPQPQQRVKPFTSAEIVAILGAFRSSPYYSHYADFVYFLFGTGCRFGEAAGLRWSHVADDFKTVWIGESISRGSRKSTKTGKARTIVLSKLVAEMLTDRRQAKLIGRNAQPEDLVFPSPKGLPIDDHNFRSRAWKTILEQCNIEYRKPYAVRHSVISHALSNGANPMDLAEQTGHDKRVLLDVYAHAIAKQSLFVEF